MLVSLDVTVLIATGYLPFLITTTWSMIQRRVDKILDYYHNLNNLKIIIIKLYYLELISMRPKIMYVVNLLIHYSIIKK